MSFYRDGILEKSTILHETDICHGFSTRLGGVSTLPHTASMNVAEGHGDDPETVRENIDILASTVSGGKMRCDAVICAPQIHSATIRRVTAADAGSGVLTPASQRGDGFVTDERGILLMVRMADCVPILFSAVRDEGSHIVAAVHAGWRGAAAGIAGEAVRIMTAMGARPDSIRCAIGQSIHACCYEVREDFTDAVTAMRGKSFAEAHIRARGEKLFADIPAMNRTILLEAGLHPEQIDLSHRCTACAPDEFHSHRASHGLRGAMGAVIGIL